MSDRYSLLTTLVVGGLCMISNTTCLGQGSHVPEQASVPTTQCQMSDVPEVQGKSAECTATAQADTPSGGKGQMLQGSFVAAPIPISSPAIGSGIVPVLSYIFPVSAGDKVSPASVIGVAGLVTNNGSRGFAAAAQLYLHQNTYRITAGFIRGNINYDLYGLGSGLGGAGFTLPLKQNGQAFLGEALRRIGWKFFLGPRFLTGSSVITVNPMPGYTYAFPSDVGLHTALRALGFRLQRDTSLNRFYPTNGTFFDFTADFFSQDLGSKYSFQSYKVTFNKYVSLTNKQILAYNSYGCATGGKPPFYGNCIYGTNNELRGYTAGQYLDRYMVAAQVEYRLTLPKRFGFAAFVGVGEVIPGGSQLFRNKNFLPALGGGPRFELSKKYHVNLRADIAQGKDGHTFGVGVGEAF